MKKLSVAVSGLALVGALCVPTGRAVAAPVPSPSPQAGPATADSAESSAVREAVRSRREVEVTALTTETRRVVALPTGRLRAESSPVPLRKKSAAGWRDLDGRLGRQGDGRLAPAVATQDVSLSGGGQGPLVSFGSGGRSVQMFWPSPLPAPQVAGDTAVYPEVAAGIDLAVRTSPVDGVSQYLVVKDRAAAASPLLSNLVFSYTATGVTLRKTGGGSVEAVGSDGRVAFTMPALQMWGSAQGASSGTGATAAEKTRDVVARAVEAKTAPVGVEVTSTQLKLTPSKQLLEDPATVFPVVIDPVWFEQKMRWAMVWSDGQSFDNQPDSTNARVGYDGWQGMKKSRVYYQMWSGGPWNGKDIIKASFRHMQIHSPNGGANRVDCNLGSYGPNVELGFTGVIPSGVSWSRQPAWLETIASNGFAVGSSVYCADQREQSWDITNWLRAHQGYSNITFGLRSADESNADGWRQYTHVSKDNRPWPILLVEYNSRPDVPGAPWVGSTVVNGTAWVNTGYPAFRSIVRDPDGGQVRAVHMVQQVDDPGVTHPVIEVPGNFVASGDTSVSNWFSDWGPLCNCTFEVWARAEDPSGGRSADSPRTRFVVDTVKPAAPAVVMDSPEAHLDQRVKVTFTAAPGDGDVVAFRWNVGSNTTSNTVEAVNGSASVSVPFSATGPQTVTVVAIDRVGNESAAALSTPVKVTVRPAGHTYTLDGTFNDTPAQGTAAVPLMPGPADLTAPGRWFYNDPSDENSGTSVCPDKAYRLDTGYLRSESTVVDTRGSFSVMAWARPDAASLTMVGDRRGVLSLPSGWPNSAMILGLHKNAAGKAVWAFGVSPGQGRAQDTVWVDSTVEATAGTWAHLTGVYDQPSHKLRLYVNGQQAREVDLPPTTVLPMGDFLGIGMAPPGDPSANTQWIGVIDDVRTFTDPVDANIARNPVNQPDPVECPTGTN